jgi:hypothetical protein
MVSGSRVAPRRRANGKAGSKAYPFVSKAEVRRRLATGDLDFVLHCLRIMQKRTAEREAGRAPRAHRWGWASSDKATGASALAERLLARVPARGDKKKAATLLARYTVQLGEGLRLEAMARKPELVETAKVYGVAPSGRRRPRRR